MNRFTYAVNERAGLSWPAALAALQRLGVSRASAVAALRAARTRASWDAAPVDAPTPVRLSALLSI